MNNTLIAGMWRKDVDAYDPQARVREFTLDGRQFTAHSLHADGPDQWPMTVREVVTRRYVATVLNWTKLPEQLATALQPLPESGSAHIHVGANMPGYLPESDVMCFDSVDGALDALRHELRDQQEFYYEGCEATTPEQQEKGSDCCAWCDVAGDVEAALSAIKDSGPDEHFVSEGRAAWIFSPPEGADIHHWALSITADRDSCEIAQEQDA